MLDTDLETICWLIVKVREFEVDDSMPTEAADDDSTLAPDPQETDEELGESDEVRAQDDPIYAEAKRVIDELNEDAQIELVALTWLGRGDYTGPDEWQEAVDEATNRHAEINAAEYLLGNPHVADYLEEGLSQLGLSCEGTDAFSM
ncbi:DUF3775 domain-containing protein [Rhodovibrio salinarum]|uniref:DUF3775 domain-containing protein n=1 Tax=Rhodovibrio salinarum TaxID=1087 RepID=A0A934QKR1_9PROT|nr:DUF3775 domain-containing protein [Rhodovibrio salinarum]MBK1698671.1 DUF3775 domain-containing protein [Rhodovibrio salinarum]